jgi:hypothetical protein
MDLDLLRVMGVLQHHLYQEVLSFLNPYRQHYRTAAKSAAKIISRVYLRPLSVPAIKPPVYVTTFISLGFCHHQKRRAELPGALRFT